MIWTIGVDVGGTFTDVTAINENGEIYYSKMPTTPGELHKGIMDSLNVVAGELDR